MRSRLAPPFAVAAALLALAGGAASTTGLAQPPSDDRSIEWTAFVAGAGPSRRTVLSDDAGVLDLGASPWACGYGAPTRAAVSVDDWSQQRILACQRGEGTVSATASCRVRGDRVEERAASLSLGTVGESGYVTVTLSCRRPSR